MFKENIEHNQIRLISFINTLPNGVLKMIESSWAKPFYEHIFRNIDESKFKPLYSDKASRPNKPTNILVCLEVIKQLFNYSDEELIESFHTDLRTMYALGLTDPGEVQIAIRTIYYFRKRLIKYEQENHCSLIKEVLKDISLDLKEEFGLDLSIQRMDSSLIDANIKSLTRLNLFAKILHNFLNILPEDDVNLLPEALRILKAAENLDISYRLKSKAAEEKLLELGEYVYFLHERYKEDTNINASKAFKDLARLIEEHLNINQDKDDITKVDLTVPKDISSSSIQSPTDTDASYRFKDGHHKGYVGNFAESCSESNAFQIITEVAVEPNNVSDTELLNHSLIDGNSLVKEANDLLTDGAYLGKDSDAYCGAADVNLHVSAIKGPKSNKNNQNLADAFIRNNILEKCPAGKKPIKQRYDKVKKHYSGKFRKEDCSNCPFLKQCFVKEKKNGYYYFFKEREYYIKIRKKKLEDPRYREFLKLRAGAESMIYMMFYKSGKKTRFRGLSRVKNSIIYRAIGVNLLRLQNYVKKITKRVDENSVIFISTKILSENYRKLSTIFENMKIFFLKIIFKRKIALKTL